MNHIAHAVMESVVNAMNRDYLVTITTTWIVNAESEEQAIEEFSDGNQIDRTEKAELLEVNNA